MGRLVGRSRALTFWGTVAGLLPLAYASSFMALGPTPAEGCSGSGSDETGVIYLSASAGNAYVGRDGFFPFRASTRDIEAEAALAAISVEVLDSGGEVVPGETVLIREEDDSDSRAALLLGWSATAALADGTELTFHAQAMSSLYPVTLDASLSVLDVEPELTLPSFHVTEWTRVKYDAGAELDCGADIGDCESHGFGTELRDAQRMTLEASPLTAPVLVLWEYDWVPVSGKGTLVRAPYAFGPQSYDYDEELWFAAGRDEYCALVRGRDLHTGEAKEEEICASPSSDGAEVTYDSIGACEEPPAGYLERWCRSVARVGDSLGEHAEECEQYLKPSAGTGGSSGENTGGAGAPEPLTGGTGGTGDGSKGGTSTGGTAAGRNGARAGAGALPEDSMGGAGSPSDEPTDAGTGSHSAVTQSGCGCRTVASSTSRETALAGAGLFLLTLALGLRRGRQEGSPRRARPT